MSKPSEGDFQVWWISQVPMKPFTVLVETREQGEWLCGVLAAYDKFQYENNVKPDYSNVGGVHVFEDGNWRNVDDDDLAEEDTP